MSNDPCANIRRALDAIQASARGHRHKRELAHLDFREACDPDTIRELLAERDQLAAALEAAREDAERYRFVRRKLCLTGNGNGTCGMQALNLPAAIPGWPEPGKVAEFCDTAIDQARGKGVACRGGIPLPHGRRDAQGAGGLT